MATGMHDDRVDQTAYAAHQLRRMNPLPVRHRAPRLGDHAYSAAPSAIRTMSRNRRL